MTTTSGYRARGVIGLILLTLAAGSAQANLWHAAQGQRWFYEVRQGGGELMAGRWWQPLLEPGKRYRMTFHAKRLDGVIGVRLGAGPLIEIDRIGDHSYEFDVEAGAPRRLLFTSVRRVDQDNDGSLGNNPIVATITGISVTEAAASPPPPPPPPGNAGGLPPKGHYLSFSRERNLKTEMLDLIDDPASARSDFHLRIATDIADAFRVPGVKGFVVEYPWRSLEPGDGRFDWQSLDDNMTVAERFGLRFIVKVQDKSFDGSNVLPAYFPGSQVLTATGGGKTGVLARRWDPYVYERAIRLYRAIGDRYGQRAGFGGIMTTETATGTFSGGGYSVAAYRNALTQIIERTQPALGNGVLFLALNFLPDDVSRDMNRDGRVSLVQNARADHLAIGGPDITPDASGMPGSNNSYRKHLRGTRPGLRQYCHLQHTDQGRGGRNKRSNANRNTFFDHVERVREREAGPYFSGTPATFVFDDLRDRAGNRVDRHPAADVGALWHPRDVFDFAMRNFDCDYGIWHYRENIHGNTTEFWWPDIRPIIESRQNVFN